MDASASFKSVSNLGLEILDAATHLLAESYFRKSSDVDEDDKHDNQVAS